MCEELESRRVRDVKFSTSRLTIGGSLWSHLAVAGVTPVRVSVPPKYAGRVVV